MRTTVSGMGQIEIDEVYVGVNKHGVHFVVPVQAKGGTDRLGAVQSFQDIACCKIKFPNAVCKAVAVQFMDAELIAMFELMQEGDDIKLVDERHYRLVPKEAITPGDLERYRTLEKP